MRFLLPALPDTLELIPSVAVLKGYPVWVKDERYHSFRHDEGRIGAREIMTALSEQFPTIHYMDLGGISRGDVDLDLLRTVCSGNAQIMADTGIAFSEMVIDAIMAGASRVVVSTKSVISLDEIASSFELTENLVVELAWDGERIIARDPLIADMEPKDFIREMSELGITDFIVSNMGASSDPGTLLLSGISDSFPDDPNIYIGASSPDELSKVTAPARGAILSASYMLEGLR